MALKIPRHLVLALLCSALLISARRYTVGDEAGWNTGINYTRWATGKTFFVGDSLYFEYVEGDHNVLQVDDETFNTCTISATMANYTEGDTTVELGSAGTYQYVCGVATHCLEGQKLQLVVNPVPAASVPAYILQLSDASHPLIVFKQQILWILAAFAIPRAILIPSLHRRLR